MGDPGSELFGREREVARLSDAVAAATAGRPSFVLATGEAGIGKTRLLRATSDHAAAAGLRTLWGTSIESGHGVPYLPLLGPLRLLAGLDGGRVSTDGSRPPARDDALAVVRRALSGGSPDGSDARSGLDSARFVEAVFDLLARRPTLLVVDDVHWADASTLTVLDYLAHRAVGVPLVVVAAARDERPAALASLPIADGRRFERLELGRLSVADVRRQAASILGDPVPAAQALDLHRRAAGNPFFVEQLLAGDRTGSDDGAGRASTRSSATPASLRALVLRRVIDLPEDVRALVDALAVLGGTASADAVAAVVGCDPRAARSGLAAAGAAGITVPDDAGSTFRHPLFAEVIEAALAPADRRALHAAAARVAEERGADAATIANHWWEARDTRRAWRAAREAARSAVAASAFAEAWLHLERAISSWPDDEGGVVDALREAARMAWHTGDPERALVLAARARAEAPDRVDLVVDVGTYAWDAGRRDEAVEAFGAAVPMLGPDAAPEVRARATWGAGRAAVASGDPAGAVRLALDAAAQALVVGDLVLASEGYALAAMGRAFAGSLDGIPWLDESVALALRSGATFCVGHGYQFLVDLRGLHGDGDEAVEAATAGIDACARVGIARTHGSDLRGRAALLLLDRGELDSAIAVLDLADPRAFPSLASAFVAMRRGAFERAARALDEAAQLGAIGGPGALGGWLELARVELAWLRGDAPDARRWVDAIPFVPGIWGDDVGAWAARWRARIGVGEASAALEAADRHPDERLRLALATEIGAATAGRAVPDEWAGAAAAWDAAGRPWEAALARLEEASARFAVRETPRGRAALESVLATAEALDAAPLRTRAADLARRARIRLEPAARTMPAGAEPTARELEVLVLLSDGLTNPEIADRLFLSPKTVGIHVSRLLAKLGAHTRGEAVAVARRRGYIA